MRSLVRGGSRGTKLRETAEVMSSPRNCPHLSCKPQPWVRRKPGSTPGRVSRLRRACRDTTALACCGGAHVDPALFSSYHGTPTQTPVQQQRWLPVLEQAHEAQYHHALSMHPGGWSRNVLPASGAKSRRMSSNLLSVCTSPSSQYSVQRIISTPSTRPLPQPETATNSSRWRRTKAPIQPLSWRR
ncbi:unnamed protein product [Ectocarpus sp. 12 AP-2014]